TNWLISMAEVSVLMFFPIGFVVLLLEIVEPFADEFDKLFLADLEMVRLDDGSVDFVRQHLFSDFLFERRIVFGKKAPFAGRGFDDALAFQFSIRFGDSVAVQAQLLGQRTNGRKSVAGTE